METETDMLKKRRRKRGIARDGERITVPMVMMDAQQQDAAMVLDAERADADARQLAAAQEHADTVQRWADHFAGRRDGTEAAERVADNRGQLDYEQRTAEAWKNPPTIPTGA